jgi:para-nitrobenzyl esterase
MSSDTTGRMRLRVQSVKEEVHSVAQRSKYVFNNLYATDLPWTDEDGKIADVMSSYWANFAVTGDPNAKALPRWPAFHSKSETVMELGDRFAPIPVADERRIDFMKQVFLTQGAW